MFKPFKKKTANRYPLMHSPVYCKEILGGMYTPGEFIPHARMKNLFERPSILAGIAFKDGDRLYFVASHPRVISHIKREGLVPLSETDHLHFFRDKKRMNAFLSKKVA